MSERVLSAPQVEALNELGEAWKKYWPMDYEAELDLNICDQFDKTYDKAIKLGCSEHELFKKMIDVTSEADRQQAFNSLVFSIPDKVSTLQEHLRSIKALFEISYEYHLQDPYIMARE